MAHSNINFITKMTLKKTELMEDHEKQGIGDAAHTGQPCLDGNKEKREQNQHMICLW